MSETERLRRIVADVLWRNRHRLRCTSDGVFSTSAYCNVAREVLLAVDPPDLPTEKFSDAGDPWWTYAARVLEDLEKERRRRQ